MAQVLIARQVRAEVLLGLPVTAGVVMSIPLKHFGGVGFEELPANAWRRVGAPPDDRGVAVAAFF